MYCLDQATEGGHRSIAEGLTFGTRYVNEKHAEHQAVVRPMAMSEQDVLGGQFFEVMPGGSWPAEESLLHSSEFFKSVTGHRCQQRILVRKVVIGRSCRNSCPPRHRAQCYPVNIGLGDELERG